MRKFSYLIGLLSFMFFLLFYHSSYAAVYRWIKVGKYQGRVLDSGSQSVRSGQRKVAFYDFDGFNKSILRACSFRIGTKDWTDENGNYWPVKIAGSATVTDNEEVNLIPLPDEEKITIRKYMRYQPPTITVDGLRMDDPFPFIGDEVNPDKIPGTADLMIESWANTMVGLTLHQRVLAWSQAHHDDYIIYDITLINTGNVDLDDEIELPNQTLKDVYILRTYRAELGNERWYSCYGEFPTDSLRIMYAYPQRSRGSDWDDVGYYRGTYLPYYSGEAMLHVGKYVNGVSTDDPSQPQMTAVCNTEVNWERNNATELSPGQLEVVYNTMQFGFPSSAGTSAPYMENTYPETHHAIRMDELGYKFPKDPSWWVWGAIAANSSGPFTLAPGDSVRIVFAGVAGGMQTEKAWQVLRNWEDGTCEPPEGFELGVNDNLPPQYEQYPELYAEDAKSTEYNNWAKDCWIFTGKDSLFQNAWAAQWNQQHDYNVPIPPPPPSIEIRSMPDYINVIWTDDSESASDFAGYRVYRATGSPFYSDQGGVVVGRWTRIFECGKGTGNALTHNYKDTAAERGVAYYYYVTAFDDGTENGPDAHNLQGGEILESGMYLNMTTYAAHLTRPAGTLSKARVVPNPFNVNAAELQYPGEPDKIMFMELPPICTIKIYSESGDLVKTLEHTDGSGDEPWGVLTNEQSVTETGQIIVSGIYIAYIETPEGESTYLKFAVVR